MATAATNTCPHGMPTPATCWTCMEDGIFVPGQFPRESGATDVNLEEVVVSYTFKAKHPGRCAVCPMEIAIGEPIAALDTDPVSYAHLTCLPSAARSTPQTAAW